MSTYWNYVCMDHDPPLQSTEEVTQHTEDEYFWTAMRLIGERPIDPDWQESYYRKGTARSYFEDAARRFLMQHPRCRVVMLSETGQYRTTAGSVSYEEP